MSKEIRALEDQLIETLNGAAVPHEVKRLILQHLLNEENRLADAEILREMEQEQKNG